MQMNIDKLFEKIRLGNSFRVFGGLSLLVSIWVNNPLALKVSLITFIFGGLSRALEVLNKMYDKNKLLQFIVWIVFLLFYSILINGQIQIFKFN
jgi:hypothetical protein